MPAQTDAQRPPATPLGRQLAAAEEALDATLLGKRPIVRLALTCLLAEGHLLIEDIPGVGKTTLSQGLAHAFGLAFRRVQFTNDLLPSDVLGVSVYSRTHEQFEFHHGPIFTQVLLADEINRATAKTQSALLEAMEEHQVSVDGQTHALPSPFFVIATQNPMEQIGTHPLPESQLDRFLFSLAIGYPDPRAERALLERSASQRHGDREQRIETPRLDPVDFRELRQAVRSIHIASPLFDHIQALLTASRRREHFRQGLSPRAGLGMLRASQAHALLAGRDFVTPQDVEAILEATVHHRLRGVGNDRDPAETLLELVPAP